MAQSVLEKDAQQQQHISTPNIRVDHIGNSASEPNRGGAGQHKSRGGGAGGAERATAAGDGGPGTAAAAGAGVGGASS